MYKKVPIFRCTTPSTGKKLEEFEVVVGTLYELLNGVSQKMPLYYYSLVEKVKNGQKPKSRGSCLNTRTFAS